MHEIFEIAKEVGVGAVAMIAISWIAVYLVRKFVDVSCSQLSLLVNELKIFMARARDEHKALKDEHGALMDQHKEMIITLGRINGYKED